MSKRKGKVKKIANFDEPTHSDSQINYTFEDESENPFSPRPRLGTSPILTRSRALAHNQNFTESVGSMAEDNHNLPFGPQPGDTNVPRPVEGIRLEDLTLRLERVLTLNHNVFMSELSGLRQTLVDNLRGGNRPQGTSDNTHPSPIGNNNQRPAKMNLSKIVL